MTEPAEHLPSYPEVTDVHDVACKQCGYDLSGLRSDTMCPECGLDIERSLTDDQLINSSPDYLASLHRGVVLILATIAVQFAVTIGTVIIGIAAAIMSSASSATSTPLVLLSHGSNIINTLAALTLAWGWWLFSAPDPAFTGREDGSTARKVVRVTILINAAITLVMLPLQFTTGLQGTISPPPPQNTTFVLVLVVVLGLAALAVWATSFFASMLYLRWLTPRIPHWAAYRRAKTFMWLGPLLYIVGSVCLMIGPLIALVLYWNMLNWVRIGLKNVRDEQAHLARQGNASPSIT